MRYFSVIFTMSRSCLPWLSHEEIVDKYHQTMLIWHKNTNFNYMLSLFIKVKSILVISDLHASITSRKTFKKLFGKSYFPIFRVMQFNRFLKILPRVLESEKIYQNVRNFVSYKIKNLKNLDSGVSSKVLSIFRFIFTLSYSMIQPWRKSWQIA